MASESKKIRKFSKFVNDNKYAIAGVIVAAGAFGYYALSSKNETENDFIEQKKEESTNCDECDSKTVNNISYATPMDAFKNGKREQILYTTATRTDNDSKSDGGDFVAVVDVDPLSKTYCTIISKIALGKNQEVHHSGWNACASCFGMTGFNRQYLVVPAFTSGDIHFIDVTNERNPQKYKTVSGKRIKEEFGLSYPHTIHCLANGKVMISFLGVDKAHPQNKNNSGTDFLWFNDKFEPESRWISKKEERPKYGYDFWYQPFHNVMISTEWGTPQAFSQGFNPEHVKKEMYGTSIHFWDWKQHKLLKTKTFDASQVCMPLEIQFCHDPKSVHAFCGAALTSNVVHIYKNNQNEWVCNENYICVDGVDMNDWALPTMPGLLTDVLISMDDKYIYFSNWLHGDIRQYDISDPFNPKLNSQCFVGGCLRKGSKFTMKAENDNIKVPIVPQIKGRQIFGGPQMLQLSLDGKRLYVTNSLFSAYDKQFYPDLVSNGGQILLVDIDLDNGAEMKLNTDFVVDFGECKGGPARPHEMRYPGGDCTSDIFLVQ